MVISWATFILPEFWMLANGKAQATQCNCWLGPTGIMITWGQHNYNYLSMQIIRIISILLESFSSDEIGMESLNFMEILSIS